MGQTVHLTTPQHSVGQGMERCVARAFEGKISNEIQYPVVDFCPRSPPTKFIGSVYFNDTGSRRHSNSRGGDID
jgi:hypothetical protein